jgi:hypothetical protein
MVPTGEVVWYAVPGSPFGAGWRFLNPGFPLVPAGYFQPCESLVYRRARSPGNMSFNWTTSIPYSRPTRTMTP